MFSTIMSEIMELECNGALQTWLLCEMGCCACCYGMIAQQHIPISMLLYTGNCDIMIADEKQELLGKIFENALLLCQGRHVV